MKTEIVHHEHPGQGFARFAVGLLLVSVCSCSGGGGSGSSGASAATLLQLSFPDPRNANSEPEDTPPSDAPLIQQVLLVFDEALDPDRVNSQVVSISDASGFPVPGRLQVSGTSVTFTPQLPLRIPGGDGDGGGAGLLPGGTYFLRISAKAAVAAIDSALRTRFPDPSDPSAVLVPFHTTQDPSRFFLGLDPRTPKLVGTVPADGSVDFSPQLYTDPEGLFARRGPIRLQFDAPLDPSPLQLDRFALVDLDDARQVGGLPLGVTARLVQNEIDGAVVEMQPSGILPFGHTLSVEVPEQLRSLGNPSDPGPRAEVAATLSVAKAPERTLEDQLLERFDDSRRRDTDADLLEPGQFPAEWDQLGSGSLRAGFAFVGAGELGRFLPPAPADGDDPRAVILDTTIQNFPLLDGSTPDAPAGFQVVGGRFSFTDIDIPDGVIVEARGANPLRMSATGTVRIAGQFRLSGLSGQSENAFDSAVTSLPGGLAGSGGGRGGESHPIFYFPPETVSIKTLVSPQFGGRGWGPSSLARIGGGGGQCGHRDNRDANGDFATDSESSCGEFSGHNPAKTRTPGGGGGSHLQPGSDSLRGRGNVTPDGSGGWVMRTPEADGSTWRQLIPSPAGVAPFQDGDPDNDFVGVRGELQEVFGGQGGGAGGSMSDAYFCGRWCRDDADPTNDEVCQAEFGNPPNFADAVGDSRAGSGGGAGGALLIQALGAINVQRTANLDVRGASGGGGEQLGCSCWGASGGSGSGGCIVLQSAAGIRVRSGARLQVDPGAPRSASADVEGCGAQDSEVAGAGARGGHGLIQLQVPAGETAKVDDPDGSLTDGAWVDRDNLANPSTFSPISVAISTWYDLGRAVDRPPADTNPLFSLNGLAPDGMVPTDAEGQVLDPQNLDLECDYLGQLDPLSPGQYLPGQEPRADFIPPNATIQVQFQGADAITEGSKEVDPSSLSPWTGDPQQVSGRQFLRYRVLFDITADGSLLGPTTPRPTVQTLRVRARF